MTSTPSTSATKKEEEKALALANAEAPLPAGDRWLTPDLEAMARRMGEGGNYWDLRAAELNAKKAFFCVWMRLYQSNARRLAALGLPATKVELSDKLGVSRVTLAKWEASDWYRETGVPQLIRRKFDGLIFKAIDRLETNIDDERGTVSNQAIKMALDYWQLLHGLGQPETAVQVNVINESIDTALRRAYGEG